LSKLQIKMLAEEHAKVGLFGDVTIPAPDATGFLESKGDKVKFTEMIVRNELNRMRKNIIETSKASA
jgi:bifunctional DNA-binding transcriptional regulator/antitoxin component of YhaV-PrlF toxin-antitoxin module